MDELTLYKQFQDLYLNFPGFILEKKGEDAWQIRGKIRFSREYLKRRVDDEYLVEILVLKDYPISLPKIFEIEGRIPIDFHRFQDEALCLGAPLEVKAKFRKRPTLLGYVDNCVIPYLYSYSYKCKFGKLPFGELSHGGKGLLEFYQNLFGIKDPRRVQRFLEILSLGNYQDRTRCPCGSGRRLRICHGSLIDKLLTLQGASEFNTEWNMISRYLISISVKASNLYFT